MRHETFPSPPWLLIPSKAPSRELIDRVAAWHHLGHADIIGRSRCRHVIEARFDAVAAVHLAYPHLSRAALGRIFRRDQATIFNALRKRGLK